VVSPVFLGVSVHEAITIILVALVLDWLFGDPRWLPHPVVWIGRLISSLERFWRKVVADERTGGVLLLFSTVVIVVTCATLLLIVARLLHPVAGLLATVWLSWTSLAARSLHRESRKVADVLAAGDLDGARKLLSYIVGRDTAELTEPEIWRATVETVAENTSDGVIAPLFFLMVGGPLAAIAYKAVNTLDSMVGYKNERYLHFGWASARFDDVLNFIPARLTGWLIVLAAPLLGLSGRGALSIMLRDGRNHSSPNAGIPEAAAAGALGVQLGGTNRYFGKIVEKSTIGDSGQVLSAETCRDVVRLMYGAEVMLVGVWLIFVFA
jgi:adenosylcobinamide-phosphate synthase